MLDLLIERRRALHRIPELCFDLPLTREYVARALSATRAKVEPVAQSGLLAYFDFGRSETVLFRSDMDALPIEEQSGAAFRSGHPGRMHACGHDGHMAMLLALADHLNSLDGDALPRNVLLVFQPAEESGGGGGVIVRSGALEPYNIVRAFALHVDPMVPQGTLASRPGPFMARASEMNFVVHGRSAHVGRAGEGIDAVAAAADFLYHARLMEQALPPEVPRLLKFGRVQAGTAPNILAEEALLSGSVRAFDDAVFDSMCEGLRAIAEDCRREYGATFDLNFAESYPAVVNDEPLYRAARGALSDIPFIEMEKPSMIAEDFSYYTRRFPAVMLYVGLGTGIPLHSDRFNFDERALITGVEAFIRLARMA